MAEVTFEDVRSEWQDKTRGGHPVIAAWRFNINGKEYILSIVHACDRPHKFWNDPSGRLYPNEENTYDLIPRRVPNPLEGLPRNAFWRRSEDSKEWLWVTRIDSKHNYVHLGPHGVPAEILKTWQHTADPTDPNAIWTSNDW